MADTKAGCNDSCGCPSPCPGGQSCRCSSTELGGKSKMSHMKCSCGDHCGCNPCTCTDTTGDHLQGTGMPFCKCTASGCTCPTCAA